MPEVGAAIFGGNMNHRVNQCPTPQHCKNKIPLYSQNIMSNKDPVNKSEYQELNQRVKELEKELESTRRILSHQKSSGSGYGRLLENLGKIDRTIKRETDIEPMLRGVLEAVSDIFGCDGAWVLFPCDPEAVSFSVPMAVNGSGNAGVKAPGLETAMTPGAADAMREALSSGMPLMYGKGTSTHLPYGNGGRIGVKSEMLKAIHPKIGKPWLFGIHHCSDSRVWTMEEQNLFDVIGRRISDGLTCLLTLGKLKRNEQQFRAVFEQAAVGVALCDSKTGKFVKVNKKYADIVGYPIDDLCRLTFQDITHPDDIHKHVDDFQQLVENRIEAFTLDKRYCRKDGSVVCGRITVSPLWKQGETPNYHMAILQDITEQTKAEIDLKNSENRYKNIFNNLLDVYIETDLEGTILELSPSAEKMSGYEREALIGTKVLDYYADKEKRDELLSLLFANGMVTDFEADGIHKDGHRVPFSMTARLVKDPRGNPIKLIGMLRNLEERKKAEMKLQQVQKLEAIGTLAGGIAHDFNNILSGIRGYSQLAGMHLCNPDQAKEDLEAVQKAGEKATELVQQILTISRQSTHNKEPLEVHVVVREALKLLRATLPSTIRIKTNIRSGSAIMGDPTQIHQVVMNLATNAYHAMIDGKGVLSVGLKEISILDKSPSPDLDLPPGRYLRLDVSDTGRGMDSTLVKKIFDPYFTTKDPDKGTGLGLAVVLSIIEEHKGKINVHSTPGAGSSFHVYLPIIVESENPRILEKENETPARGSETVLLVDDDDAVLGMTRGILMELGYTVAAFSDAAEAFHTYARDPIKFDIVVTDMTMPGMTGFELSKRIFEMTPDQPIILCTGFSESVNKEKALSIGIVEYLEKPIMIRELARVLRSVLDQSKPNIARA